MGDAVFKELLVHEGLSQAQCEHVITKLMQREGQLEYLFHEWSGVFPTLPSNARHALSKGLLPTVGRCPHAVLDFVLKELESLPMPAGRFKVPSSLCSCRYIRSCGRRSRAMSRDEDSDATEAERLSSKARTSGRVMVALLAVMVLCLTFYFVYSRNQG